MNTLLKLAICLVLMNTTLAFADARVYQEHENGWTFSHSLESGLLTHPLFYFQLTLTCEPADCGPYCYGCKDESNKTWVFVEGDGQSAVLSGEFFIQPVVLLFKDLYDPAITVHDNN
ncbi:MAG: hypothetical protein A2381_08000 [Bdellovibrionales bacterium RIFOXYB1_FULL_37_110]|nr:MAG: hypothetical protein A2181_04765 [Bdellovibrionales bacterium RIFOXYA1_FULL_38_20]OFZ52546.1 MAG: hypothetical protein A2417_00720 [Bdellovibrionales bacterium RIFOXYC1_FULL_37_79]OFZ59748.1 MAG: hypothetical protein A2381_08000 [Bdellovibrionales bacterium RIFOXYB1_FULL_37_110]OFZ65345.1 MAG: hypothetical protein A2577_04330 [Bdellovibrionales bacterium RIFOXYD1_FULL_36_51]